MTVFFGPKIISKQLFKICTMNWWPYITTNLGNKVYLWNWRSSARSSVGKETVGSQGQEQDEQEETVFLECQSFCLYILTSSTSLREMGNKGTLQTWESHTSPALHASELCRCRLCVWPNSTYFTSQPTVPMLGRAGGRKGRSEAFLSVLFTMWFHYSNYDRHSN